MDSDRVPASLSLGARLWRDRAARLGLFIVAMLFAAAVAAPWLSALDPNQQHASGLTRDGRPAPPGTTIIAADGTRLGRFVLGADNLGRDLYTRLLYGARISLAVGLLAMLTAVLIGAGIGLLAGYFGGWVDLLLMRLTDIMLTIPTLVLAIALAVVMPKGLVHLRFGPLGSVELPRQLLNLFLVIGLVNWTGISRVVRSEVLRVRSMDYILAARAIGCGHCRVMLHHVLPNVLPTILVLASLATANTILLDAGLSYLGIGTPPPIPSWGAMINDGQPYLVTAGWMILGPGGCVVLAVLGFNLIGQGLQQSLHQ